MPDLHLYVVTVDFSVVPDRTADFADALIRNAEAARRGEPGCLQFDVCRPLGDATRFFLYELYHDAAAFQDHLASDLYRRFDAQVSGWITEKRVAKYQRVAPSP